MNPSFPMPLCPPRTQARRALGRLAGALVALGVAAAVPSFADAKDHAKAASERRAAASRAPEASTLARKGGASTRVGLASVYSRRLAGRRMANGAPMRLDRHNAASVTLPLGSMALVTNLANGERAVVTITDRGPFVRGRIIDLTPYTAQQLGIAHLARVEVVPIVPTSDARSGDDFALAVTDRDEALSPQ